MQLWHSQVIGSVVYLILVNSSKSLFIFIWVGGRGVGGAANDFDVSWILFSIQVVYSFRRNIPSFLLRM